MLSNLKPGDQVTVWPAFGGCPSAIRSVAKIGKRKITLSDNSEWTIDGRRWGVCHDKWCSPHLAETRPDDALRIRRANLLHRVQKFQWETLRDEPLQQIAAILDQHAEEAKQN